MPITVQHGPPVSTIAPLAYDTGRMAGQEERRRYDQKIGMQQARDAADERRYDRQMMMRQAEANADRAYRAEQSDLNRQFQLEQQDRAREMRMEEWGMKADSEKQRLRQQRTAYERQSQQIEQAMSDGLLSRTEAMQAHEELSKRFSPEVIDAFIPTPQEEEKLNRPMMKMDDGTEWPVAITKDGKPDYFETWKEYQRLSLEREKIRADQEQKQAKTDEALLKQREALAKELRDRRTKMAESEQDPQAYRPAIEPLERQIEDIDKRLSTGGAVSAVEATAVAPSIPQATQDQVALPQKPTIDMVRDLIQRADAARQRGDMEEFNRLHEEYKMLKAENQ